MVTWNLDWDDNEPKPTQLGLFPNSCSRCGQTEWGAHAIHEGEAVLWVVKGIEVTWRCVICNELVCDDCILCKPVSENQAAGLHPMFAREIWDVTYCSATCRALNIMSYATDTPLCPDLGARAELKRCFECGVWMHSSVGHYCSGLCCDVQWVRGEMSRWRSRS